MRTYRFFPEILRSISSDPTQSFFNLKEMEKNFSTTYVKLRIRKHVLVFRFDIGTPSYHKSKKKFSCGFF